LAFSPSQQRVLSVLITGGFGGVFLLITTLLLLLLVPQIFVQVAVYVPVALTVIVEVVAPVLHESVPVQPVAVNAAVSLLQIDSMSAVTVGAAGLSPFLMSITFEFGLTPQIVSHLTA
jgi:hypothetical protein